MKVVFIILKMLFVSKVNLFNHLIPQSSQSDLSQLLHDLSHLVWHSHSVSSSHYDNLTHIVIQIFRLLLYDLTPNSSVINLFLL